MTLEEGDPRHGTINAYNHHGCRCQACRGAMADYRRRTRPAGFRIEQLRSNYSLARAAGFDVEEARRRRHWADPLNNK